MIDGAVIYAKELDRLVAFYSAFGLNIDETQAGDYAVLTCTGGELSIVQIPEHIASRIEIADPPAVRSETPIKLSFVVPSIDEALKMAGSLGGTTDPRFRRWVFRGRSVQDAIDPEGNVYQLRQPK